MTLYVGYYNKYVNDSVTTKAFFVPHLYSDQNLRVSPLA